MKSSPNVYEELKLKVWEAEKEFQEHTNKCAAVTINASTSNMYIRKLHGLLDIHFVNLIYYRRISDGGENTIKLIAPKEEIADALELCLLELSPHCIVNSVKTHVVDSINSIIDKLRTTSDVFPLISCVDFNYEQL